MKLGNMIILYLIITLVLILFQNIGSIDPTSGDIDWLNKSYSENLTATSSSTIGEYTTKVWWDSLLAPNFYNQGIVFMLIAIASIMVTAFVFGSVISGAFPSDTFIFAPLFIVTLGLGLLPTFLATSFVMTETSTFMCVDAATNCMMPTIIGIIVGAVLFIPWLFACIRHWRTGVE